MNEAQFPEFIHEHIYSGTRRPDDFRQRLLRYFRKHLLRLALLAITGEQQQSPGQSFLNGVEELIDKILLNSNVSAHQVGDERV
jgi:hypothetical protein